MTYSRVLYTLLVQVLLLGLANTGSSWALRLSLPEKAYQGDLIVGRSLPPAQVKLGDSALAVSQQGYFVLAVARGQQRDLVVRARNGSQQAKQTIRVLARKWRVQKINGLPQRQVTPGPEALKLISADNLMVRAVREARPHPLPLFLDKGFIRPVPGAITGVFGSQRILNGHSRNPHSGVDYAAPRGTPVHSPADGIVRLVARDMYLMGNTLMIDHGLGVCSIFIHLHTIEVLEGDLVRQGQPVARVGSTGRATGPHLHWGVSVRSTLVDPARLLDRRF